MTLNYTIYFAYIKFENLKKGNLLIAEPSILNDLEFNRSVILISEHNKNGTVGFILNKPTNHTINELLPEIDSNHIALDRPFSVLFHIGSFKLNFSTSSNNR